MKNHKCIRNSLFAKNIIVYTFYLCYNRTKKVVKEDIEGEKKWGIF